MRTCSMPECEKAHYARGWCNMHYQRWQDHGDPNIARINGGVGNTPKERFWSRVAITANPDKCWEWQAGLNGKGYGNARVNGKVQYAHRIAWFFEKGYWPKACLLHRCDNPKCVNPNHLFEGSHADNMVDKARKGRCNTAKLNADAVREIRSRLQAGQTGASIATSFGIDQSSVSNINRGNTWRHV